MRWVCLFVPVLTEPTVAGLTCNSGKYLSVLRVVNIVYRPLSFCRQLSAKQHLGEGFVESLLPA